MGEGGGSSIGNLIVEIRRSYDRLISTMGFMVLVRLHLMCLLFCNIQGWLIVIGLFFKFIFP